MFQSVSCGALCSVYIGHPGTAGYLKRQKKIYYQRILSSFMDHSRNGTLMQTLTTSLQQGKGQELHNIKH
jgi:hypothetical protein